MPHPDFRTYLRVNIPRFALFGIALVFLAGCATASVQPTIQPNSYGQSGGVPYSQVDKQPKNVISIAQMNADIERLAQEVCPVTHCDPKQIVKQSHAVNASSPNGNMAETDEDNNITFYLDHPGYTDPSVNPDTDESAIVEEITHGSAIPRNVTQKDGFKDGVMKGFNYNYAGISADEQMVNITAEEISTRAIDLQISPRYSNPLFNKGGKSFLSFLQAHNISTTMLADFHSKSAPDALAKALGFNNPKPAYQALVLTMYAMNLDKSDKLFGKVIQPINPDGADKFLTSAYAGFGGK